MDVQYQRYTMKMASMLGMMMIVMLMMMMMMIIIIVVVVIRISLNYWATPYVRAQEQYR